MATRREKQEQFARAWSSRVSKASENFNKWESRFNCKLLDNYIEGKQLKHGEGYVLNLFYSSIKVKKPSLIFSNPEFQILPKPWKQDWNPELAFQTATLKKDTINSIIQDQALNFAHEIDMCIIDSWSYFGVLEVGYSANWIRNPNAGKPILKGDYLELTGNEEEDKVLFEPEEIPEKEQIFFRRIPAHRFRVSGNEATLLEKTDWCGYYTWVRLKDILSKTSKKHLLNFDEKEIRPHQSSDYTEYSIFDEQNENDIEAKGDYVKLWKIWDNVAKEFIMLLTSPSICIYREPFKRLPLFDLRFDKRRKGFYPIPVTYNWKSPQDEFNEARNQMRDHRRRARQMWQAQKNTVESDEKEKFVSGPSGTLIETNLPEAIKPINNASLDASIIQSLNIGPDEFDKVSATSNNQRGVSDRTTATESNTIEARTRIREETDQAVVATWLNLIAKEVLNLAVEHFTEPFFIKRNLDSGEFGQEYQALQTQYQLIHAEMLNDGADFDVSCTVTSLSPVTQERDKQSLIEFMALIQQYPVLTLHPSVIRKIAYLCNFRDETVIQGLIQAAHLAMVGQIAAGEQSASLQGGNAAETTLNANTPPDNAQIQEQIVNQIQ